MNIVYWFAEYISAFIEIVSCFVFCGIFIDREKIKKKGTAILSLSLLGAMVVAGLNAVTFFGEITIFLGLALLIALQVAIYKKLVKSLLLTLAFFAIIIAVDFTVVHLLSYISGVSIADISLEHSLYRILAIVFTKSLLAGTIFLTYRLTAKNPPIPKRYTFAASLSALLLSILPIALLFRNLRYHDEGVTLYSALFAISLLLIIIGIFIGALKLSEHYENKQRALLLEQRNQMLISSMTETEKTFMLWRSSLHDYKNNTLHLLALAEKGDLDEIKTFLIKENELFAQRLFYYKTGNDTVDMVLNVKQAIAHDKGLPFLLNAVVPETCRISDSHLCAILGNLIDNAINASIDVQEPYIEVNIKRIEDFLVIKVVNRFSEEVHNARKSRESQTFHGIGLKSVRRIIKGYDGEFSTTAENELFVAKVIIQL